MQDDNAQRFWVSRSDLRQSRLVADPDAPQARPLAEGEARLRIESFALTANNITYAAFGETMKYWEFFPTGDAAWGCIPVWGFAVVSESRAEGVAVGARCYGYWPMGRWLVVRPTRVRKQGFDDGGTSRGAAGGVQPGSVLRRQPRLRCHAGSATGASEAAVHDLLPDRRLSRRRRLLRSPAGAAVQRLEQDGLRHRLLLGAAPWRAGCAARRRPDLERQPGLLPLARLLRRGAGLRRTGYARSGHAVGVLRIRRQRRLAPPDPRAFRRCLALQRFCRRHHWDELGGGRDLPGPRPTLFFAPAQIAKRSAPPPAGWGPAELQARIASAWRAFMQPVNDPTAPWLRVRSAAGPQAVREACLALLDGKVDARDGLMLSL